MKLLEQAWLGYANKVLPASVGADERIERRRAFYAGAAATWGIVVRGLSADHEATADDMALMVRMTEEIEEAATDVGVELWIDPGAPLAH